MRVLVVDDEDKVRTALLTALELNGASVTAVASAAEAMARLARDEGLLAQRDGIIMPSSEPKAGSASHDVLCCVGHLLGDTLRLAEELISLAFLLASIVADGHWATECGFVRT